MVQYLYAYDINGSLINISDITSEDRKIYYCPSCGMEMSAVLGNKRDHHFRHKGDACSYESYLHKVSKLLLKLRFDKSLNFEIAYYGFKDCPNTDCKLRDSYCSNNIKKLYRVNLKDKYNACEIEESYNGYKADVKLYDSDRPGAIPLFLEIAVSHKCSPEKISSGIPIIEIPVIHELDVLRPMIEQNSIERVFPETKFQYQSSPTDKKIKFYNFNRNILQEKMISRFSIYKNKTGYLQGKIEKCIGFCSTIIGSYKKDTLFEILFDNKNIINKYNYLWHFGMFMAVNEGINIKNCKICQNYKSCKLPTEIIDTRTNQRLFIKIPISMIR